MGRPRCPILLVAGWLAAGACGGDGSGGDGPAGDGGDSDAAMGNRDLARPPASDMALPPPPTTCQEPAAPVDTSQPKAVVGTGMPGTCTEQALRTAVAGGGVIAFNCGAQPATITVTAQLDIAADTTLDGKNLITLSGGGTTRILHIASAWNVPTPLLTVQNLAFTGGFTTDVPNTTSTAQGGAAIFQDGGSLTVIHCTFTDNHCAQTGQDVSGGAINGQGVGKLIVEDSVFTNNSGSNGGAIGTQDEDVTVVNSTFGGNSANGTMGNPGNGGDGGALSYDGAISPLTLCGDTFSGNTAGAQGGAIFRVAYNDEPTTIDRCLFDGNSADATVGLAGGLYLEDTTIAMSGTTISHNSAHYGGGIWIGHAAVAQLVNVTIADNTAEMGGGVWFANMVTGSFQNVTVANNTKDGLFGGDTGVALSDSLVAGNSGYPCTDAHGAGAGPSLQFPGSPGPACSSSTTAADPLLGALGDNGGPTPTLLPGPGSPAIGQGVSCPPTDQRGMPRKAACTLGAVEAN